MAEEESKRETGGLVAMDSMESRWVFQAEDETEMEDEEEDLGHRMGLDSEDDENGEQMLIRTGPRIDSFDVEVPGVQRNDSEEFSLRRRIILAFHTLGFVFGDVGTSPLYTITTGDEDVLGGLSLVLYTLILIPLIKSVLVVLWANDDGEGGTFALYSLICRHAKASLLPN